MSIIARKGEEIRDAEGNLVATLARDIRSYEPVCSEAFILPNGTHPMPGEMMQRAVWEFFDKRYSNSNQTE